MPRVVDTTLDISPPEILRMDLDEYVDMCAHDDWSVGCLLATVLLRNPVFLPLPHLPAALQKELIMQSQATWVRTLSFLALLQLTLNVSSASDLADMYHQSLEHGKLVTHRLLLPCAANLSAACMTLMLQRVHTHHTVAVGLMCIVHQLKGASS